MEGSGIDGAHQDLILTSKNLSNPNKSRARGPSGRKPPTRKAHEGKNNDYEETKVKNNLKLKIFKGPSERQYSNSDANLGKIDPADFDKVLFFSVPTGYCSTLIDKQEKQEQEKHHENSVKNNNVISTNSNLKERSIQPAKNEAVVEDQGQTSNLLEKKSKKLKPWKSCAIL